jgi:putative PIN family toxin of toxin-antitoxin system
MRVFLDTNVLASAVATRGLCADVFREVLGRHELVTCEVVLRELRDVLVNKFGVSKDMAGDVQEIVREDAILAASGAVVEAQIKDKGDLPILSAALAARADVFVTGDKELVRLRELEGMPILSPRAFWEKVATRKR